MMTCDEIIWQTNHPQWSSGTKTIVYVFNFYKSTKQIGVSGPWWNDY